MALRPEDFKSHASTSFATRAWHDVAASAGLPPERKSPAEAGLQDLEAEVGIEPAYADLQSAA